MKKKFLLRYGVMAVAAFLCCAVIVALSFSDVISPIRGKAAVLPQGVAGAMDDQHTITLNSSLTAGSYTLVYENESGPLAAYEPLCTLEIATDGAGAVYDDLIPENCAPVEAVRIGVYNSEEQKCGYIPFAPTFKRNPGARLYTFAVLSDVHMQQETGEADFKRALQYLNSKSEASFICISGDLTDTGTPEELSAVRSTIEKHSPSLPVYLSAGNHDIDKHIIANNRILFEKYTGNPLCYSFTQGDDVFIMFGVARCTGDDVYWGKAELQWLYETLEANRGKRCFLFQHMLSVHSSGDALNAYPYYKLSGNTPFESLLRHYPNVVWFHGHSHSRFELQSEGAAANYERSHGYHSVHVSSLSAPRDYNADRSAFTSYPEESQGYLVDVYENAIILRGRDFISQNFLPIACYYVDTTFQAAAPDSFTDPTGVIDPREKAIALQFEKNVQIERETGEETFNERRAASQMIPVSAGAQYALTIENDFYCAADLCFYDENEQYLGYITCIEYNTEDWDAPTNTVIVSPLENAAYLRIRASYAPQETEEGNDCYLARITLGEIPSVNP